jgi:hypothetical protein
VRIAVVVIGTLPGQVHAEAPQQAAEVAARQARGTMG